MYDQQNIEFMLHILRKAGVGFVSGSALLVYNQVEICNNNNYTFRSVQNHPLRGVYIRQKGHIELEKFKTNNKRDVTSHTQSSRNVWIDITAVCHS
jgi:hypothetical protein